MKVKKVKNPDSPGGRKDWEGRSPRQRMNFTHPQLAIIKEMMDEYFSKYPHKLQDKIYSSLEERVTQALVGIEKPLLEESEYTPLWDD